MSKERENFMAMADFRRMADAKSFVLKLMDEGIQFAFCPSPISVSYPLKAQCPELATDQVSASE